MVDPGLGERSEARNHCRGRRLQGRKMGGGVYRQTHVQQVIGTLLYYTIAVDNTMLVAPVDLTSVPKKGHRR